MTLREKVAQAIESKIATNKRKQVFHVYVPLKSDENKDVIVLSQDEYEDYIDYSTLRAFYQGFFMWKSHWKLNREQQLDFMFSHR